MYVVYQAYETNINRAGIKVYRKWHTGQRGHRMWPHGASGCVWMVPGTVSPED